ncbi:MAG: AI-2E family transporter [Nanoarchaeota archaeon]
MIEEQTFKKLSVFLVLGVLALLAVLILWPILTSIVAGLILSYIFYPAYKKVFGIVREKNISALIIILLVLFLIFIPVWFFLPLIVQQIFNVYLYLQNINLSELFIKALPNLAQADFSRDFTVALNTFFSNIASKILSSFSSILLDLPSILLKTAVVFFVFFFGMRDAELLLDYVKTLSPFSKSLERDLEKKFRGITSSVIYGFIIVGILQGILTGVGLFIFRMPNALVLTILAVLGAIIPVLGAWIVWLPSSVYLLVSGHLVSGIGLALYGSLFVSWIDNIIKPYIVARKIKISSAVVLIGMIGGLIVFGILGLIIGPLILSYLLLFLDAYRKRKFPSLFFQKT